MEKSREYVNSSDENCISRDPLLRKKNNNLEFWIDEIFPTDNNYYTALIIPNINSEYFPPYHLRKINIKPNLLEKAFFVSTSKDYNINDLEIQFKGTVKQGGHYKIPISQIIKKNFFNPEIVIEDNENIFGNGLIEDNESEIKVDTCKNYEDVSDSNVDTNLIDAVYLYCFNVNQGDTFLLIPSNGNPYIIDTNLYTEKHFREFVREVKMILAKHKLNKNKIKGLIITHKHLDHLRGAKRLIESNVFNIEYFFINKNYEHKTKSVHTLLKEAKNEIKKWVNINQQGKIKESNTDIYIKNPDKYTNNKKYTPNINDSSICLTIKYGDNLIYMTGDASYDVLIKQYKQQSKNYKSVLKVSHHGSKTGTNKILLSKLAPKEAFISAGNSYGHPDKTVKEKLEKNTHVLMSKEEKKTICYKCDGKSIKIIYPTD